MLTFDDFRELAKDSNLKSYEKVGFSDIHRDKMELNIFPDICEKLGLSGGGQDVINIMDIGCGCSKPVLMLIEYARENNCNLFLLDSEEMLSNLPDESFIYKIPCEFPLSEELNRLEGVMDFIIIYSVLHHVVVHGNYVGFIDAAIKKLKINGRLLLADIPNVTKKKRFLSSEQGVEFHQNWSQSNEVPQVIWNELEAGVIDDSLIFSILSRYRGMGCETYLLEQKNSLPMNRTREDILIKRN